MAVCDARRDVLSLLPALVDYPGPELPARVEACRALVAESSPRAAALLEAFADDLERTPAGRLEELYAVAFDLELPTGVEPSCYPYVGHHLLGETYRRSRFMVGLLERYREHGFEPPGGELPDHLLVILRFLAHDPDSAVAGELVGEGLLPALERMTHAGEADALEGDGGRRVYLRAIEAIRLVLAELWPDVEVAEYELGLVARHRGPGVGLEAGDLETARGCAG
jgi:nitrate reductase delta subunit